jgi:type II secretory ATPase GspE/PulE/Tfp pilus assembly ATPase PilB-like protein/ActR/RegA family two-component response regulator
MRMNGLPGLCEPFAYECHDLAGTLVPAQLRLLEYRRSVHEYFKAPSARRLHADLGSGILRSNRGRQTDGTWFVVSDDAEFDGDLHARKISADTPARRTCLQGASPHRWRGLVQGDSVCRMSSSSRPSHWLIAAAARAKIAGASDLSLSPGTSVADAWDIVSRALGISMRELGERTAPVLAMKPADLDSADRHAVRLVPEKLARKHAVFPIAQDDVRLIVATSDPNDLEAEQSLAFASGRRVEFRLAAPFSIGEAIEASYSPDSSVEQLLGSVGDEFMDAVRVVEEHGPGAVKESETNAAPVVKLTSLILRDAVLARASDVHIEPGAKVGGVRFRIDGVMRTHMQLPNVALGRVVSRIKVLSKLDIADRMRPQDGRARIEVDAKTYDLRVSTVPTREAEKAVIRILRPDSAAGLADCGMSAQELARVRQLLGYREGIVIVTGPTGSGKTTTLYSALKEIATGDTNIMTVEDPIEYELPGITQMQVEAKRGVTFASSLRAILRQDPDVIFVGEIRDGETAQIAAQAALTGHLVLATLHTNDAMGAIARLADLGLDRATIASAFRGAIAQRLMRRLCTDCARLITEPSDEEKRLGDAYGIQAKMRAIGCKACANTGYRGRLPINEVAIATPGLTDAIAAGATTAALTQLALGTGMRPLLEVAIERAAAGETAVKEVERVLGDAVESPTSREGGPKETVQATVEPPSQPRPRPTASTTTKAVQSRILVVDDDPLVRLLATTALSAGGFVADSSDDGDAALARLAAGENWDLILSDLHMARMGGVDLLDALRADPTTARIPVIILTGMDGDETEVTMMDAGADDYLRKPIDPPRLVARVKAALRRNSI